jgi:1-acyl-sn-glycerol-3-phosphate acyltransferase
VPTFYTVAAAVIGPVVRTVWRPRISGLENVPEHGGFILASNHLANVDSFLLPLVCPRAVRFTSKDDFWKNKGIKGRIQKTFMNLVGTVPLDRDSLSSGRGALDVAAQIVRDGNAFAIYPEGHRSTDGLLHKGKPGAAWVAMETDAPVIPVGLQGTRNVITRRGLRRPQITYGPPVDFSDIDESLPVGARRRQMTERIMNAIQALTGQERAKS